MKKSQLFFLTCASLLMKNIKGELYKVTSSFKWIVYTPNPYLYSSSELFRFENISKQFFDESIQKSANFDRNTIHLTSLDIRNQQISTSDVKSIIESDLSIIFSGKKFEDFSDILSKTIVYEAENLLEALKEGGLYPNSATSSSLRILQTTIDPLLLLNDDNSILFVCLMIVTSLLVLMSLGIVIYALRERSTRLQLQGVKICKTDTSDDSFCHSDSTVRVGAKAIRIQSPSKDSAYDFPSTQTTTGSLISACTSPSTETSRNPLGIFRLNSLQTKMPSSDLIGHKVKMYSVGLDDA